MLKYLASRADSFSLRQARKAAMACSPLYLYSKAKLWKKCLILHAGTLVALGLSYVSSYLSAIVVFPIFILISSDLWRKSYKLSSKRDRAFLRLATCIIILSILLDYSTRIILHIFLCLIFWYTMHYILQKLIFLFAQSFKCGQQMISFVISLLLFIIRAYYLPKGLLQVPFGMLIASCWIIIGSDSFDIKDVIVFGAYVLLLLVIGCTYVEEMGFILAALITLCLFMVLLLWRKELQESAVKMIFWTPLLSPWLVWLIYWSLIAQQTFWVQGLNRKDYALFLVPGQMNADTVRIQSESDIAKIGQYPAVIKPNICTTSNRGVLIVSNEMEAVNYFQSNASQFGYDMIGQTFLNEHHEFSVMYFRLPYYSTGTIKTLGIRRKNYNTIGQYSIEVVNELINSKLQDHIDEYSRNVGWYFGRGDFRTKSFDHLAAAHVEWMEVNFGSLGDIAEKNNMVWGPKSELIFQGFPNWFRSARTAAIGIYAGIMNILLGHINFCESVGNVYRLIERFAHCGHHEHLWGRE